MRDGASASKISGRAGASLGERHLSPNELAVVRKKFWNVAEEESW